MVGTLMIHGSTEVLVPMASRPAGEFFRGRPVRVKITKVGTDETDPIEVREGLVGLIIRTMFDRDQLCKIGHFENAVPPGARTAYIGDVAEALRAAGKEEAADALMAAGENDPLSLYIAQPGDYELC